jgi:hypothetical protein
VLETAPSGDVSAPPRVVAGQGRAEIPGGGDVKVLSVGTFPRSPAGRDRWTRRRLDTAPANDDIVSGPDGILPVRMAPWRRGQDDVQVVPWDRSVPNAVVITAGRNGVLDTPRVAMMWRRGLGYESAKL